MVHLNAKHKASLTKPIIPVSDWDTKVFKLMLKTLRLKYQGSSVLTGLLLTKWEELIDEDHHQYWGTETVKKNRLGRILMRLRDQEFGHVNS